MGVKEWKDSIYGSYPNYWEIEELENISELVTDGSHLSPKAKDAGKMMCSVKDMTYNKFNFSQVKYISEMDYIKLVAQGCKPKKKDLLISKDGANCLDLLFLNNQDEDFVLLSSIAIVRLKKDVCPEFVRYFLLSPATQYIMRTNFISGSAIPRVVLKDFKRVEVLLPLLPEQKAIAEVLSSLDDKIDLLHRQNKTLEQMAETLFRQWFVEEAEDDLEECSLYNSIELIGGGTPKTANSDYWDGNVKWLSGGDIASNHKSIIINSEKSISQEGLDNSSAKLLPKYSTVISARGTVGKYCLLSEPMAFSQSNYGVKPKFKDCYFFTYLLINYSVEELNSAAYGSVFDTITTSTFKGLILFLPKENIILKFEKEIEHYFYKILNNQHQITTLEKIRDTLLPKLMSGQVRMEI